MIYHIRNWPETIDELLIATNNIYNDFIIETSKKDSNGFNEKIIIRPIPFIIRLNHITKSIDNIVINEEVRNMLTHYINIVRNLNLTSTIKRALIKSIEHYGKWISELSNLISMDDYETYDEILDLRDDIQGELEILQILNEDVVEHQQELESIDSKFKEIGPTIQHGMLTNISKSIFPKDIYWWWYFGEIGE